MLSPFHVWVNPPSTELPLRKREIRFSVGTPNGASTNSWRFWARGNDVYLACRDNFREMKLSLHASGSWRLAFTSEAVEQNPALRLPSGDRVISKWQPNLDASQAVVAFELVVPPVSLYLGPKQRVGWPTDVVFVELPEREGIVMAVAVVIVNSTQPIQFSEDKPGFVFGVLALPSGRSAQLVAVQYQLEQFSASVASAINAAARVLKAENAPREGVAVLFGERENGSSWIVSLPNWIVLDALSADQNSTFANTT